MYLAALPVLAKELNTTQTITNLSVAMYMLSMSIFPLWWSSFSEQFGRRSIYLISFALFVVFSVVCAVSTNIAMLIVFRILTGGASASVQAVGAGTIADIWESRERGRAMSMFYLGPLLGPLIAPIVGGALAQGLGWQATQYFLAIYGFVIWLLLVFLLPETLAKRRIDDPSAALNPQELRRMTTTESAKVKTKKLAGGLKRVLVDPLSVLLFLRFPPVLITVLVAAIAFGALFVANISIQQKFSQPPYGFPQLVVGLLYIPSGLGYFTASLFGGRWIDTIMVREAKKANRYDERGRLIYLPEDRMRENMWIANTMYPLGLLIFGWTLRYGIMWIVPSIGAFIFGVSSMLVFVRSSPLLYSPPTSCQESVLTAVDSRPPQPCSPSSSASAALRASPSTTSYATFSAASAPSSLGHGSTPSIPAGCSPPSPSSASLLDTWASGHCGGMRLAGARTWTRRSSICKGLGINDLHWTACSGFDCFV